MAKLSDVVKKALAEVQGEINAGVAAHMSDSVAKSVGTTVPKVVGTVGRVAPVGIDQERVAEIGYIAKSLRGGALRDVDSMDLNLRAKAVGVTGDVATLLPDGFTGALLRDIQDELNVAKLFPMRTVKGGIAHDTIALYGITAYLTAEATTGTDSAESYKTFVATTKNVLAVVRKSYQVIDDSMIDLASEVRMGIVRAIAEAVEVAVINGDIAGTQDGTTYAAASSAARTCNGIRYTGINKQKVSCATVDWTDADGGEVTFLNALNALQLAGGKYLDNMQVNKGNVALIVDQGTYGHISNFPSFKTLDKAGRIATLFGGAVDKVKNIPVIVTTGMPAAVTTLGVIDTTTPANNTTTAMYLINTDTLRLSSNGTVVAESDKDITNQTFMYTGSLRFGFSSVYDSTEAAVNTVTAAQKNVIAGVALPL